MSAVRAARRRVVRCIRRTNRTRTTPLWRFSNRQAIAPLVRSGRSRCLPTGKAVFTRPSTLDHPLRILVPPTTMVCCPTRSGHTLSCFIKRHLLMEVSFLFLQCYYFINSPTISSATIFATLIIGLMAGPAVSLYGSPTVSPVTAAW